MCLENTLLKTRFCLNWDCHNPNHLALKWPKGAASALQIGCQNWGHTVFMDLFFIQ
jgi:hypothetical protein